MRGGLYGVFVLLGRTGGRRDAGRCGFIYLRTWSVRSGPCSLVRAPPVPVSGSGLRADRRRQNSIGPAFSRPGTCAAAQQLLMRPRVAHHFISLHCMHARSVFAGNKQPRPTGFPPCAARDPRTLRHQMRLFRNVETGGGPSETTAAILDKPEGKGERKEKKRRKKEGESLCLSLLLWFLFPVLSWFPRLVLPCTV